MHSSSQIQERDPNLEFCPSYQFQMLNLEMCFPEYKTAEIEASLGQGQCMARIPTLKIMPVPAKANHVSWRNATMQSLF
jgi:hypothetical protein